MKIQPVQNNNRPVDLIYGGSFRGGKREKKLIDYYFLQNNLNVELYGTIRLDQFKEPAFSADILKLKAQNLYVNATFNKENKFDFKFLFSENQEVKKFDLIANKSIENSDFPVVNFFAPQNYLVKGQKYLISDEGKATSFIVLESEEYKRKEENQDYFKELKDLDFERLIVEEKTKEQLK